MSGALNKRQQARNERALQELIKTVPGNDRCADCGARNPGWASWSLGIFLCVRCASLHRKVGTHITKVKSLSMDSWSNDQVENMRRIGNVASNKMYNPRSVKAQLPIDADEINGALERYIRQKYELRTFNHDAPPPPRHNTGTTTTSTTSSEERPPALPPKPKKSFFGFRSSSSTLAPRQDRFTPPISPSSAGFEPDFSPPRQNKVSRIFGSNVSSRSEDSFDAKLAQLRDMGFKDDRRNSTVLRGLNGNLERTVDALARIGASGAPNPTDSPSPAVPPKDDIYKSQLAMQKTRTTPVAAPLVQTPTSLPSTNPFDKLDLQQPQAANFVHANTMPPDGLAPVSQPLRSFTAPVSNNPFGLQMQQATIPQPQPSVEQSMQALNLSAPRPATQLFPHATGGYTTPLQQQTNPFVPPLPSQPTVYQQQPTAMYQQNSQVQFTRDTNSIPQQQPQQNQNPFLRQSRSQNFTPSAYNSNPFGIAPAQLNGMNPFGPALHSARMQPQQAGQQVMPMQTGYTNGLSQLSNAQQPQVVPQSTPQQQMQPQQTNPFNVTQGYQNVVPQGQQLLSNPHNVTQQAPQFVQQPLQPQFTSNPIRHDKTSILALYNMPHLAPQMGPAGSTSDPTTPQPVSGHQDVQPAPQQEMKRSVTMPVLSSPSVAAGAMSKNPFMSVGMGGYGSGALAPVAEHEASNGQNGSVSHTGFSGAAPPLSSGLLGNGPGGGVQQQRAHAGTGAGSRESVDFMGLSMSGRHSPDAFAGLSARPFVR